MATIERDYSSGEGRGEWVSDGTPPAQGDTVETGEQVARREGLLQRIGDEIAGAYHVELIGVRGSTAPPNPEPDGRACLVVKVNGGGLELFEGVAKLVKVASDALHLLAGLSKQFHGTRGAMLDRMRGRLADALAACKRPQGLEASPHGAESPDPAMFESGTIDELVIVGHFTAQAVLEAIRPDGSVEASGSPSLARMHAERLQAIVVKAYERGGKVPPSSVRRVGPQGDPTTVDPMTVEKLGRGNE